MGEADEMMQGRNSQLDIAKGLGMTIVVLFHAQILSGVWTQFHMPLFAFLSGLLYREKYNTELNQVGIIQKRKLRGAMFIFLYIILLFWFCIICFIKFIFMGNLVIKNIIMEKTLYIKSSQLRQWVAEKVFRDRCGI